MARFRTIRTRRRPRSRRTRPPTARLTINYSTTPTASNLTAAQFLADAWAAIGIDTTIDQIEQSKLINNALFGDPAFDAFGWRNHGGLFVDSQYFWWHSSAAADDGGLALNFGRLHDPEIDGLLEQSRSEADADVRRGYAEDINRRFASECYIIPAAWTKWGLIRDPVRPEHRSLAGAVLDPNGISSTEPVSLARSG